MADGSQSIIKKGCESYLKTPADDKKLYNITFKVRYNLIAEAIIGMDFYQQTKQQ